MFELLLERIALALDDAKSVLLKNPNMDTKYIRRWLKSFSSTLKQPLLRSFTKLQRETKG
jgi:hypothetical protein